MLCKICNQEVDSNRHFYQTHGINHKSYIEQYFPRRDKHTGEKIEFKGDFELYSATDFVSRTNFKYWLFQQSTASQAIYCQEKLEERKKRKNLIYIPTQVELRSSLDLPPIGTFNKLFSVSYFDLCEFLGFKPRFSSATLDLTRKTEATKLNIIVDSREQKPLILDHPTITQGIPFGDYCLEKPELAGNLYVERKSLPDLISTLSGGYERFCREIERAAKASAYLVVLTEAKLEDALNFKELDWISKKVKASEEHVFHNIREILQKYVNVQFLFVNGRKEAADFIVKALLTGGGLKNVDLQFLYDSKVLRLGGN